MLIASSRAFAAEGVEAVDQAWKKAAVANDLEALVACYAKDALVWMPDGSTAKGHDAIRKSYADMLDANKITDATITNAHHEQVGDVGIGWGDFMIKMTPKAGGDAITIAGHFSAVAKKEGGKWVYVLDHASSAKPAE